jgi:hypothetical protein
VLLELYGDVAFARAGLSLERARELIGRTRVGQVLGGYRGGPCYDIGAIAQAIVAISDLISDVGEIEEIDVNKPWTAGRHTKRSRSRRMRRASPGST